ncbi:hypothetical protein AMECASPLE_027504 [Ameca splendens]|uniref:Uncharacterized protein n=1 Tax=Ameca splendens TaxID=208324 RepID=A0ABV0YS83_9TELE
MFNWIQNQLEDGSERGMRQSRGRNLKWLVMCAGQHFSKGEPKQTLRCSNAEALFQVPAGPFRSFYPHSRHSAASEQLDFTICGIFLCSTWFPQGSCAAGMLEAGELLLMQGTESLGQIREGSAWGEERNLEKDGLARPWCLCLL